MYFYDFAQNKKEVLQIPFEKDNSDGIKFVELFSKGNFDSEKIHAFIEERNSEQKDILKVKEEISSPDFVRNLLKNYFAEKGLEKEFDEIKGNYKFICIENRNYQEPHFEKVQQNYSYSVSQSYQNKGDAPEVVLKIGERQVSHAEFKEMLLQTKRAERTWVYTNGRTEKDIWNAVKFRPDSNLSGNIRSAKKFIKGKKSGLVKLICEITE